GSDLLDGGPDAEVRTAPAQVPAHRFVDVGVRRVRVLVEERHGLHDLASLAVATLRHVVVDPGLLHRVQRAALGQTVDGRDVLAADGSHGRAAHEVGNTDDVVRTRAVGDITTALLWVEVV